VFLATSFSNSQPSQIEHRFPGRSLTEHCSLDRSQLETIILIDTQSIIIQHNHHHHDHTNPSHFLETQHLLLRRRGNMLRCYLVWTMHVRQDRPPPYKLPSQPGGLELQLVQLFLHDHVLRPHIFHSWSSTLDAAQQHQAEVWCWWRWSARLLGYLVLALLHPDPTGQRASGTGALASLIYAF
jgi:hypothetical protein